MGASGAPVAGAAAGATGADSAAGADATASTAGAAAAASGADGIIIEVHNEPEKAICDAAQQIPTSEFQDLALKLETITGVVGKTISRG